MTVDDAKHYLFTVSQMGEAGRPVRLEQNQLDKIQEAQRALADALGAADTKITKKDAALRMVMESLIQYNNPAEGYALIRVRHAVWESVKEALE